MSKPFDHLYSIWLGRWLGYPECCIEAFLTQDEAPVTAYEGTGYIPCVECRKKSMRKLLTEIAIRRKCDTPFPVSPDIKWFQQLYKELRG